MISQYKLWPLPPCSGESTHNPCQIREARCCGPRGLANSIGIHCLHKHNRNKVLTIASPFLIAWQADYYVRPGYQYMGSVDSWPHLWAYSGSKSMPLIYYYSKYNGPILKWPSHGQYVYSPKKKKSDEIWCSRIIKS